MRPQGSLKGEGDVTEGDGLLGGRTLRVSVHCLIVSAPPRRGRVGAAGPHGARAVEGPLPLGLLCCAATARPP
eukprot:5627715-Pyramimonas_sp.AAC.1